MAPSLSSPSRLSNPTPLQLAASGYSIAHGAAILKVQRRCSLGTATQAMRQAYAAMQIPMQERLTAHLTETVCKEINIPFGPVRLGEGCEEEADCQDYLGRPAAWMITANRDAIMPYHDRNRSGYDNNYDQAHG